jgi:hypothetical protein
VVAAVILPDEGADARSRRDDATVRATIRHYADAGVLVTADDYRALPGIVGVEETALGTITLYRERGLFLAAIVDLQAFVAERKTLNLLVVWKLDRRHGERRRA